LLTSLSIKNYALIEDIQVNFGNGLTIITGETGAGKSILLGALSLILGKRADLSSVKNTTKKCIVEANFDLANYSLKSYFKDQEIDYETHTIIRREILPSGKSRAFINDSPVNLHILSALGERLIDIHSQHQNLELTDNEFQFQIIDAIASNQSLLQSYKQRFETLKETEQRHKNLLERKAVSIKEQDYNIFLLNELEEAQLSTIDFDAIELENATLSNVEEIQEKFQEAFQLINEEQIGALQSLEQLKNIFRQLYELSSEYKDIFERVNGLNLELKDINNEVANAKDDVAADPDRLQQLNLIIDTTNSLFKKHSVHTVEELMELQEILSSKVNSFDALDEQIVVLENKIINIRQELNELAHELHVNRSNGIEPLSIKLTELLQDLGMANAKFKFELKTQDNYFKNGKDELNILFTANKGDEFKQLNKAASGGELSRIMLAIKSVISQYSQLPSIIFDEIDTGVSGEISNKMGDIMKRMSATMQVLAITHLPQIAAMGDTHFKVYKKDDSNTTTTHLIRLNSEERIVEIAEMLSGKKITTSAMAHARQLLN